MRPRDLIRHLLNTFTTVRADHLAAILGIPRGLASIHLCNAARAGEIVRTSTKRRYCVEYRRAA